jgi:hypothetical protein
VNNLRFYVKLIFVTFLPLVCFFVSIQHLITQVHAYTENSQIKYNNISNMDGIRICNNKYEEVGLQAIMRLPSAI